MRRLSWAAATAAAAMAAWAAPARADGTEDDLAALRRRVEAQERRIRELEGSRQTSDEVEAAVAAYLAGSSGAAVPVGGAEGGKAGFPMGGAPFISEGPNKISFHVRNQVRYEAFLYSDDAVGTVGSPPSTLSDAAPRDRSGFEIERLYLGVDGSVFCPDLTFNLTLNLDSDMGSGVEKEFCWIDWKYAGEHHVRAGTDKVPFTYEEQNSSAALAFVDRALYTKAFALDSDTGVMLWGNFGPCDAPKQFLYRVMASTGEGPTHSAGSVFSTDAFDTYSDQLLFSGLLEWTITGKDWKWDEVDHRPCDERCRFEASLGVCAYHEDDDDTSEKSPGLALRSTGPLERTGLAAWFRARYQGWTLVAEAGMRRVEYSSGAPDQQDSGAEVTIHHRFAESNFGLGVRAGMIWLDDAYDSLTVGNSTVAIEDTISELGFVVNYFFWDHGNKLSADVSWVQDNSAVRSSSAGYLFDPSKGVVVEDGLLIRVQWQLNF
ncbi:MAG: hypothetical protein IT460_08990 [Planctomycetes bacterium]|nr:hypothetical protein [Planctomycetota bacterium]